MASPLLWLRQGRLDASLGRRLAFDPAIGLVAPTASPAFPAAAFLHSMRRDVGTPGGWPHLVVQSPKLDAVSEGTAQSAFLIQHDGLLRTSAEVEGLPWGDFLQKLGGHAALLLDDFLQKLGAHAALPMDGCLQRLGGPAEFPLDNCLLKLGGCVVLPLDDFLRKLDQQTRCPQECRKAPAPSEITMRSSAMAREHNLL